jgi:HPt (histidine-containing phosphotransfer) domain-containing protein
MKIHKGMIATGVLSGLVIITMLVVGLGNIAAVVDKGSAAPQETKQIPQAANVSNDEALQAWQQYSAELEQAVLTLQARESSYQAQIEMANQTILQLQDELNAANASSSNRLTFRTEVEHEGFEHDD